MPPFSVRLPLRGRVMIPIGKETVGKKNFSRQFFCINFAFAATFPSPGQSNMQKVNLRFNLIQVIMADFIPIAICFLLPVLIVAIVFAFKSYDVRKKTELVAKALEHGENVDPERLIKSLSPKKKSVRQKLYTKMTTGFIFSFMGAAIIAIGIMDDCSFPLPLWYPSPLPGRQEGLCALILRR